MFVSSEIWAPAEETLTTNAKSKPRHFKTKSGTKLDDTSRDLLGRDRWDVLFLNIRNYYLFPRRSAFSSVLKHKNLCNPIAS